MQHGETKSSDLIARKLFRENAVKFYGLE
jgi:hypothetical protein